MGTPLPTHNLGRWNHRASSSVPEHQALSLWTLNKVSTLAEMDSEITFSQPVLVKEFPLTYDISY